MPPSDLEREQQQLVRAIAEKERQIGEDLELIRQTVQRTARQASTTTLAVLAGVGLLIGAFVTIRAVRALRPRYVVVR